MRGQRVWSCVDLIDAFQVHLEKTCGFAQRTCSLYAYHSRRFLVATYGEDKVDLDALSGKDLASFVMGQTSRTKPAWRGVVGGLRAFVRFLLLEGLCDADLRGAVPKVARWRLSTLPSHLSEQELTTLVNSFDRSTGIGLRDYAIVQCLATLGLRIGEVARLSLDDIDWRTGVVHLPVGKSRRAAVLPLPRSVGCAIVAYLRKGRPTTAARALFVCHRMRVGAALSLKGTKEAVGRAFRRAGVNPPPGGRNVLRHTAATRMIRNGASLKDIADVLRHKHLDTTAIYAKVDVVSLAQIAAPWPEVQP